MTLANKLFTHKMGAVGKAIFTAVMAVFSCQAVNAQVNIAPNQTALALAQKLTGFGVIITNPVLNCPSGANGIFRVVKSDLGIDSGILLTTGSATQTNSGPATFISTDNLAAGDAFLNSYTGSTTKDACALEFDFQAAGDTVRFNYAFASEEYTNYSCSQFNDVFGFFISGPGIAGQRNIALVPGTTIPVAVNSITNTAINVVNPPSNIATYCESMGAGSPFAMYYVPSHTNIAYDGFTTTLTAESPIYACSTYHLKLVIADVFDGSFDSGVWLEAGSLSSNPPKIAPISGGSSSTTPYVIRGCKPGQFVFTRNRKKPLAKTVKFDILGTAVNGTDYSHIPDSVIIPAFDSVAIITINGIPVVPATGKKTIKIVVKEIDCSGVATAVDSAELELWDGLRVSMQSQDTALCQGAGIIIRGTGEPDYTYTWSPLKGVSGANTLTPLLRPDTTTTYTLVTTYASCPPYIYNIKVEVQPNPKVTINSGKDTSVCQWYTVPLKAVAQPAWFTQYAYAWSPATDMNITNKDSVVYTANANGQLVATVTTPIGCIGHDTINVNIYPGNFGEKPTTPIGVCPNDSVDITVGGGVKYQWVPDEFITSATSGQIQAFPVAPKDYIVYVTDQHNCFDTLDIHVDVYPGAVLYLGEDIKLHPGEKYQMFAQGTCTSFNWFPHVGLSSVNSFNPVIEPKVNTRYIVTGASKNGCPAVDTIDVYMVETELGMPNAFAPYSSNHELKIVMRGIATLKYFRIFNRWGQKVFETQDINKGWDGRLNGEDQPTGVYVYVIEAETDAGKPFHKEGNVTLIR